MALFSLISCMQNDSKNINVAAAASLQGILDDLILNYETKYEENINVNYAGSYTLTSQINRGLVTDVFIPAGIIPVNRINRQFDIQPFISNKLVLISPDKNDLEWDIDGLKQYDRIAIADPNFSPAGEYSIQALNALDDKRDLHTRLVYAKDVSAALLYVKKGLADLGIVYFTDSIDDNEIFTNDVIPEDTYSKIQYPIVTFSNNLNQTNHLINYLFQQESLIIIKEKGFKIHD
tara:strand:+ start:15416 stop:16117 length:702 start_codon:yes stop_codon:yes gene_type:complete